MKNHLPLAITGLSLSALALAGAEPQDIEINAIGSVAAGDYEASAAEIAAHDPDTQRVFVVNAQLAQIDVVSIADPAHPRIIDTLDVKPFGKVANSVAVSKGLIAVAVESAVKTAPGKVVFFDNSLNLITSVDVGALPDMLTFTPNGRYLLVANEGEPSDDYLQDPEGSVSVIEIKRRGKNGITPVVRTAGFGAFTTSNLPAGVRIFGPNATVPQDMEPEYIAISKDSKTAWVTCQENNAIAVVDIASAAVTKLIPLGTKDHAAIATEISLHTFDPASLPSIGNTLAGQPIPLGGFSGLHFEGTDPATGRLKFLTHTDRGPNAEPTGILRPFLLPNFAPELVRFELDPASGALSLTQRIALQRSPGVPLTGLPNLSTGPSASTPHNDEVPVDLLGNVLTLDPLGGDLEGVVTDAAGNFWMVDEYRPAIYQFDPNGVLIERFVPQGAGAAAGQAPGSFGSEVLPSVIAQRRQNRGFEAIALDQGKIYAFVQSPVRNPATLSNGTLNGMRNVRVVEFDLATRTTTRQFLYVMDNPDLGGIGNTRADKIGDAVSFGNGEFLVVERDDDKISVDAADKIEKKVYRFNLAGASDITSLTGLYGGKTIDQLSPAELATAGIRPIAKVLHTDLAAAGYDQVEKVEGLTLIDEHTLAVINDNDFGVADITVSQDGSFVRNSTPDPIQLGLIGVGLNGIDASDRDSKINIRQWPVKGLFMPDAIASFRVDDQDYLITANEGDAREYIYEDPVTGDDVVAFAEVVRVGSSAVQLDPARFPFAATLKNTANLGRLNITNTLGRNPSTGLYEELYAFGTRSFTVWNSSGEPLFDSGEELERVTAAAYPANFNASNTSNAFDSRSDDKGPEPEGVVTGKIDGRTYAFIGLERIGGVVVYDVSVPAAPRFVQYLNNRDFSQAPESPLAGDLGPEGLLFIAAHESPNKKPLLVIANEVSGTTTVYEITAR
jgi:hypothetical protein